MPTETDPIAYLSGTTEKMPLPFAIGRKFDENGRALKTPGNTFLCHVPQDSEAHSALIKVQDALRTGPHADSFTFLPPASFHMTIFEGVIDYARQAERWPKHIAPQASVQTTTDDFRKRIEGLSVEPHFRVQGTRLFGCFSLRVTGADASEEQRLRGTRDVFRKTTQILRPDHESYEFHITIGYLLRWLSPQAAVEVQALADQLFSEHLLGVVLSLGPVEFCQFETMHRFDCLVRLKG